MLRTMSALLAACAMLLAPWQAAAQNTFRCSGKDGKKYYGQTIPNQCIGQAVEEIDKHGNLVRKIENQSAEDRALKKAAEKKKLEEATAKKEEERRNRALLATYSSEKDIEEARTRALADNQQSIKEIQARIDQIRKRQAQLAQEMEFYKKNPAPQKLQSDVKQAQVDFDSQQNLLEVKKKEVESINARYDEDKKRFLALTGKK
jgi:chromosome segregation ATPase